MTASPAERQKRHRNRRILGMVAVQVDVDPVALAEAARAAGYVRAEQEPTASDLSAAERALFTRRRKDAYEALHPETRNGGDRRGPDRQVGELKEADRFTADAAAKTGKPERTIQRDAERGESIPEPILQEIAGDRVGARLIPTDAVT